ncbi:hypothetical protein [uncultured Dokdonia sp.]|uniref:hypothetical protein n=1 Tax=uncultured Dokdonia sp. TaxID=575653 RepID=UPI002613D342|nr:hypothetical protein [uncultured Dokdonia sp.]
MNTKKIFGVVEVKKENIKTLESEILAAQNTLGKQQAIVGALKTKSVRIEKDLAISETNKNNALTTKNLLNTVMLQVEELLANSKEVAVQTEDATSKINEVSQTITMVTRKLIYAAELSTKLSNLVIRKKAVDPLISDELISLVTTASVDANNAVSLTLTALNSIFTAQTPTINSDAIVVLENKQVTQLYESLTASHIHKIGDTSEKNIKQCIDQVYENTLDQYTSTLAASTDITKQLHHAKADLATAKTNLESLEAALAAANAAMLAS